MSLKKLHPSRNEFFNINKKELDDILDVTLQEKIYPKKKNVFKIFKYIPPNEVTAVILGQDPYINYETVNNKEVPQAEGLSFSVPKSHKNIPPSLKNIFKEIKNSYPDFDFKNGNLKRWVKKEKIFLLNSALTVIPGKSNSHQKHWEKFTDKVIKYISDCNENTVFILMGNNAKSKFSLIDSQKHIVLTSVHPSPLSANRGFFGCNIFKIANDELEKKKLKPINWQLNRSSATTISA